VDGLGFELQPCLSRRYRVKVKLLKDHLMSAKRGRVGGSCCPGWGRGGVGQQAGWASFASALGLVLGTEGYGVAKLMWFML